MSLEASLERAQNKLVAVLGSDAPSAEHPAEAIADKGYQPVEKRCSVKITPNKIKGLAPVFWNKNEFFNGLLYSPKSHHLSTG